MKKTWVLLMMVLVLVLGVVAGCGSKEQEETKAVVGTFMEKKDFMFTVKDAEGKFYGFNFDVKPKNYADFNDGDVVKVTYTGTISEVDPFDGEILSIEKLQK